MNQPLEKVIPSLAFLAVLTDNSKDIYDVLSSLTRFALRDAKKTHFTREEALNIVNEYYGFDLPSAIIHKAIKRMCDEGFSTKKIKGIFNLDLEKINAEYEQIRDDNASSTEDYNYLAEEIENFYCSHGQNLPREEILKKLHKFILGDHQENTDDSDITTELFMLDKGEDKRTVSIVENIKKGSVLYSCLCTVPEYNMLDEWTKELHLYLSTDVSFLCLWDKWDFT